MIACQVAFDRLGHGQKKISAQDFKEERRQKELSS
jgi:hypothetical protein